MARKKQAKQDVTNSDEGSFGALIGKVMARSKLGAEVRFIALNQVVVIGEKDTEVDASLLHVAPLEILRLINDGEIVLTQPKESA